MKARGRVGAVFFAVAASCAPLAAHRPEAPWGISAAACLARASAALQDLTAADPEAARSILAGALQARIIALGGDAPSQPDWTEAARMLDRCALS